MTQQVIDTSTLQTRFNKLLITDNDKIILTPFNCIFIYNKNKENWVSYTSIKEIILYEKSIKIIFKDLSTTDIIGDNNEGLLSNIFSSLCLKYYQNKPLQYSAEIIFTYLSASNTSNILINCLPENIITKELDRQKFKKHNSNWIVSDINSHYQICDSYPQKMILPNNSSLKNSIIHAKNFRDQHRFPIISYLNASSNLILRSSQPMTGIMNKSNSQDEFLIKEYLRNADISDKNKFIIVDCRPLKNVYAQKYILGGGTENMKNYQFTDLKSKEYANSKAYFLGFPNVHILSDQNEAMLSCHIIGNSKQKDENVKPLDFDWYLNIQHVLKELDYLLKEYLLNSSHLLIHCTHGWDRTSLMTSLLMICTDPYYRTIEGFFVLIQLEWLNYGFRFAERFDVNEYFIDDMEDMMTEEDTEPQEDKTNNGFFMNKIDSFMDKTKNNNIADIHTTLKKKLGTLDITAISNKFTTNDDIGLDPIIKKKLSEHSCFKTKKKMIDHSDFEQSFNSDEENEIKKIFKNPDSKGGVSPVFIQFLDIIYQLIKQHESKFQYNGKFLLRLLKEITSGKYYEFLLNNDKERTQYLHSLKLDEEKKVKVSWYNMIDTKESEKNSDYETPTDQSDHWIFPNESKVTFWKALWRS